MDRKLARRLSADPDFRKKISKVATDYIQLGTQSLEYYVPDFDQAHDAFMCYAPIDKEDFDLISRGAPKKFILPMTATQVTTLATFIAQILFGTNANRRVEGREDQDEAASDHMNQLLRWNDDQDLQVYQKGHLMIQDSLIFNRGVTYDYWKTLEKVQLEEVQETDEETGEVYNRYKKQRVKDGGYNRFDIVSPYDFICDPALPLLRMQEGRFAGHRVMIPFHELERRSKLKPDDADYVLPETVEKLKTPEKTSTAGLSASSNASSELRSRSAYERQRRGGLANVEGKTANKDDGGVIECWNLQARMVPSAHDIFPNDDDYEIVQMLVAGSEILALNIMPNTHDQFTYSAAEARPWAHYQFSPSWALLVHPIQDLADYMKNRRQDALARTSGNIFIGNPKYVDFKAFTDPKKEGLFIPLTEDAPEGVPLNQVISQVPIHDVTKDFYQEMQMLVSMSENTTGAHAYVQGEGMDTGSDTLGEFEGIQQMSSGRITSTARMIWNQAIGPQTQRYISNFQQFLDNKVVVRINGEDWKPDDPQKGKSVTISRESIQGNFDLVIHDAALPGSEAKKTASASRLIEAITSSETLMGFCDPTVEGNIDFKQFFIETAKATGVPMGHFTITAEQAAINQQKAAQQKQAALYGMAGQAPPQQMPAPGQPSLQAEPAITQPSV